MRRFYYPDACQGIVVDGIRVLALTVAWKFDGQPREMHPIRDAMNPLEIATPIMFATPSLFAVGARGELSAEELAKLAQNPVGNLVSVPFQNNTNFSVGPLYGTQNILNIQPEIPATVNKDWNIVTRTILHLVWHPAVAPGQDRTFGPSDPQFTAFLSPGEPGPGGPIWGARAIVQAPTDTQDLGNKNWELGSSLVMLKFEKGNPWVYGFQVNNLGSLSSGRRGGSYSNFLIQSFVNCNFPDGFYVKSVPIITANWKVDGGQQWTVPPGMGIGRIFHVGKLPVNTQLGAYYNVVNPDNGADWQLRFQPQFMFPKRRGVNVDPPTCSKKDLP
jgi:hypothetical protein